MMDEEKMKRWLELVNEHGVSPNNAQAIVDNKMTLQEYQDRKKLRKDAGKWAKKKANRELALTPQWDLSPSNYHRSMDGEDASDFTAYGAVTVLYVDAAEMYSNLTLQSTPVKDPWSSRHRSKTQVTAYRWHIGLPVTPPFIEPHHGRIIIRGGMHRFHLARHHDTTVPVLVEVADVVATKAILPSAKP